jgi:hypothetical protein
MSNEQMDSFDPFQMAKVEKEAMREARENKNNYGGRTYEEYEYLGLNPDEKKVFRIVSNPVKLNGESLTEKDARLVMTSRILTDEGKGFCNINWQWKIKNGKFVADPDWFLTRVMNTVFGGTWQPLTEKDVDGIKIVKSADGKIFNSQSKFKSTNKFVVNNPNTPSYKRLKNNKRPNDTFAVDVMPSPHVMLQVIDRLDDWCKVNKTYKILATKANVVEYPNPDGTIKKVVYKDTGISFSMYEKILDHFLNFRKDWYIDCVIKRYKSTSGWTFEIQDAQDFKKLSPEIQKVISEEPLTEEEKSYKFNDLSKLDQISTYSKIKKNLEKLIRQVDIDYNTNFLAELEQLCEAEKAKFKEMYGNENVDNEVESEVEIEKVEEVKPTVTVKEEVKVEEKIEVPVRTSREVQVPVETNLEAELIKYFPNWSKLDETDVKVMLTDVEKIVPEKGIVYKSGVVTIPCDNKDCVFPGTTIRAAFPDKVYNCPSCGKKF